MRNLPGFVRFLTIAALLHGQARIVTTLARDAWFVRLKARRRRVGVWDSPGRARLWRRARGAR